MLFVLSSSAFPQGAVRYIAARPPGQSNYVLWSSSLAAEQCGHAMLKNTDIRQWCEDGVVPGVRPKLGTLEPGTRVERLNSTDCQDMVQIRILDGRLKDQIGCTTASALMSVKP
jgi:hypothetical protein